MLHRVREGFVRQRTAQVNQIRGLLMEFGVTASAIVASVGDARAFKNGRQMAAWLGLVPRQYSSGGKPVLRGISKRGDIYLRKLLVLGARAVLRHTKSEPGAEPKWLDRLLARRSANVVAVALANKNARIAWALLAKDCDYRVGYQRTELTAA
jgi:transposase